MRTYQYRLYPKFIDSALIPVLAEDMRKCWNAMVHAFRQSKVDVFRAACMRDPSVKPLLNDADDVCNLIALKTESLADLKQQHGKARLMKSNVNYDAAIKLAMDEIRDQYGDLSAIRKQVWTLSKKALGDDFKNFLPNYYRIRSQFPLLDNDSEEIERGFEAARENFIFARTPNAKPPKFKKRDDDCSIRFARRYRGSSKPTFIDLFDEKNKKPICFYGVEDYWSEMSGRSLKKLFWSSTFKFRISNWCHKKDRGRNPDYKSEDLEFTPIIHRLPPLTDTISMLRVIMHQKRFGKPEWYLSLTFNDDEKHFNSDKTWGDCVFVPNPRIIESNVSMGSIISLINMDAVALILPGPGCFVDSMSGAQWTTNNRRLHIDYLKAERDTGEENKLRYDREQSNLSSRILRTRKDFQRKAAKMIATKASKVIIPRNIGDFIKRKQWISVKLPKQITVRSNEIKDMAAIGQFVQFLGEACNAAKVPLEKMSNEQIVTIVEGDQKDAKRAI